MHNDADENVYNINENVKILYYSKNFSEIFPDHSLEIIDDKKNEKNARKVLNINAHSLDPFVINKNGNDIYIFAHIDKINNNHSENETDDENEIDNIIETNKDIKKINVFYINKYNIKNKCITIHHVEFVNTINVNDKSEYFINDEIGYVHIKKIIRDIRNYFCSLPIKFCIDLYPLINIKYSKYYKYKIEKSYYENNNHTIRICNFTGNGDYICVNNNIINFFKCARTFKDLIKDGSFDINNLKNINEMYDDDAYKDVFLFLCDIKFINIDDFLEFCDKILNEKYGNKKYNEFLEKRDNLIRYLDDKKTRKKLKNIVKKSNNKLDVYDMLKSENFESLHKLSEMYDLQRHTDKDPIEYSIMNVDNFFAYYIFIYQTREYVLNSR